MSKLWTLVVRGRFELPTQGYEPRELPGCSTARHIIAEEKSDRAFHIDEAKYPVLTPSAISI